MVIFAFVMALLGFNVAGPLFGLVLFFVLCGIGWVVTSKDPELPRILARAWTMPKRWDPGQHEPFSLEVRRWK